MMLVVFATAAGMYTAPVPTDPHTWVSAYLDFPVKGVREDVLTVVRTEITVNPYGGMSGCRARTVQGNPNMADYTCHILKNRTEFKPARDPSGKRMYGVYRQTFAWQKSEKTPIEYERPSEFQLEIDSLPPDPAKPHAEIQFAVDVTGNGSSCSPTNEPMNAELAPIACERLEGRIRVPPAMDRKGRPVPSVQTARVKFVGADAPK